MNSNTLRIRGSENKTKGGITFDPVIISEPSIFSFCKKDEWKNFSAASAEDQLMILKQALDRSKSDFDDNTVHFLVIVYLQADTKHPAKCMITRCVTRNNFIKGQFSEILTQELKCLIKNHYETFKINRSNDKSYKEIVSKVAACTENFPAGAAAVKNIEIMLTTFFKECLSHCHESLRQELHPLSPTEKNEIYNLAHSTLRLLLYFVQKVSENNKPRLISMFNEIRIHLKEVLFDTDAPMDTKSVCGILYISMHMLENNSSSWLDILECDQDLQIQDILSNESAKLSMYSALVTVVPMDKLRTELSDGEPAIMRLTNKILDIGERCSTESSFILGVTRTIVQICKGLHQMDALGLKLLDGLFIFVWSNLEHHTDSVKHLTAQALAHIIKYCAKLNNAGNKEAMDKLLTTLTSLDRNRKSFYLSVTAVCGELGAQFVLCRWPRLVADVLAVLDVQAVQASATTCLETLLQKHAQKCSTEDICSEWVSPILRHVANNALDSSVLNILENLLTLAIKCDSNVMDYILPYIKDFCEQSKQSHSDIKCLLILLSVARRSGQLLRLARDNHNAKWKDIISYDVLKMAAIDSSEENRILSISLIVESPKSTESFVDGELDFIAWFVYYNMNAQSPHFRQLVLSIMKKFFKRLENSYKTIVKDNDPNNHLNKGQYYLTFLDKLRDTCFEGLIRGANFSRRYVALQLLAWMEKLHMDRYNRNWKEMEVDILLYHLGDSYECNKALALELLEHCPTEMFKGKTYKTSLQLKDILLEASSVKPPDCVTAVYKLKLLRSKLPEHITCVEDSSCPNKVKFELVKILLEEVKKQESQWGASYGVLHCLARCLEGEVDPDGLPPRAWSELQQEVVSACARGAAGVRAVLSCAAPEGAMPVLPDSADGTIRLEDGREVTAQMVLLCAWRTVKEVSLILSTVVSQVLSAAPSPAGLALVRGVGDLFMQLLTETKHRGAFEQIYVGFTRFLTSLWRSPATELNVLPSQWLQSLLQTLEHGARGRLCATRRSAGLPFMIQALVITELQMKPNSKSFDECMGQLLRLARGFPAAETRCHCLNVLRALYRDTHLQDAVARHVADGLLVALRGFGTNTWIERNSATLLFSALVVRVFGVARRRAHNAAAVCARNRMTGRVFFLRYPKLYDYMLDKLNEASESNDEQILRPSLYPVLLLLARLYPSSLEGTVSNLKLAAFVRGVCLCARSGERRARRLAASALAPLVAPHRYVSHIESMFETICDQNIKKNYCHGVILQLLKLLEVKPESLTIEEESQRRLRELIKQSSWILEQCVGERPCYMLADEYIKMINILILRFKSLVTDDFSDHIEHVLTDIIFKENKFPINPGKELCQSNAVYLMLILCTYKQTDTHTFVYKCLSHHNYDVVLSTLNYLLVLYKEIDLENSFQEHLNEICNIKTLETLKNDMKYREILCNVLKSKYLECKQKALKLLTLEDGTQKYIIQVKYQLSDVTDELVLMKLIDCIENEHENQIHLYLGSLCSFFNRKLQAKEIKDGDILKVLRVIFECSLSDNSDETRTVVAQFLEENCNVLSNLPLSELNEEERFEYRATLYATMVAALEDDSECVRQLAARAVATDNGRVVAAADSGRVVAAAGGGRVVAAAGGGRVVAAADNGHVVAAAGGGRVVAVAGGGRMVAAAARGRVVAAAARGEDGAMVLAVVALLDFRAEVCATDDVSDESRVFDQNEKYNVYLEESIWTRACADAIKDLLPGTDDICQYLYININRDKYKKTFEKLCNDNLTLYEKLIRGENVGKVGEINPKIDIFVERLKRY